MTSWYEWKRILQEEDPDEGKFYPDLEEEMVQDDMDEDEE